MELNNSVIIFKMIIRMMKRIINKSAKSQLQHYNAQAEILLLTFYLVY